MIRRFPILCLTALSLSASGVVAQTPAADPPKKKGTLIDSLKKAIDGNKDKVSDETRQKAEAAARAAMEALPDDLKKKAQEMATDPKAAEIRQKAVQTVQGAMQGRDTPPATPIAATKTQPAAPAPVGPQPQKLQPLALDAPQPPPQGRTIITATKSGYFDGATGIGIYRGNVVVRSARLDIDCDELEVHMDQDKDKSPGGAKKTASDSDILASRSEKKAASQNSGTTMDDSGIDMAYARGSMVSIVVRNEKGEVQLGHCNEVAIFDGTTGLITLRGWPSVQSGGRLLEATDPRCIVVIDKNNQGRLKADGGIFRTTLIDEKTMEAPAAAGSTPPATTPAAPVRP